MSESPPIHDLFIRHVPSAGGRAEARWKALRDEDHLLRRFGMVEVLRVEPDLEPYLRVRSSADEVWLLIEGRGEFRWRDLRSDSPTHGVEHKLICDKPTQVLAPFGVAFGFRPLDGPALLLRISTHDDGLHEGDQRLPWEKSG